MAKEKINFEDEQVRLNYRHTHITHTGAGCQETVAGCKAGDRTCYRKRILL